MSKYLEFKISTGLKNIIGKELIYDDNIAVFELVKNSYDANASHVKIIFLNTKGNDEDGKIIIADDGSGMSFEDIQDKWLFVGFSEKKYPQNTDYRNKITKHRRIFAGAKGIGRFSADRLGKRLDLYTKINDDSKIRHIKIEWERFEQDQEKRFQSVSVPYLEMDQLPNLDTKIKKFKNGTILVISCLNSRWDKLKLIKLRKYLQRLINPSLDPNSQEFKIELIAEEYLNEEKEHNEINGYIKNLVFENLGIKTTAISCIVNKDKITTTLTDKGKLIFVLEEKNTYPIHDISIFLFYLNQDAKSSFTKTMGVPTIKYGSIVLYKNGFRIHPYGEENDDWLGLEQRKGQGYARFLSRRELIGRVELYGIQPDFIEVSSRAGGVIQNESFKKLHELIHVKALRRLERYVVEVLDWDDDQKNSDNLETDSIGIIKKLVGQIKDPEKNLKLGEDFMNLFLKKEKEKLPILIERMNYLTQYIKSPEERTYYRDQIKITSNKIRKQNIREEILKKDLEEKKKESLFFQKSVSTDKELVIDLNHTIVNSSRIIENLLQGIYQAINLRHYEDISDLVDKITIENKKTLKVAEIVSMASFNVKAEIMEDDIVSYIAEYLDIALSQNEKIKHRIIFNNISFVTMFRPLEISIILDNLISNSKKAGATEMNFNFELSGNILKLLVGDNGHGISKTVANKIFMRGFTTTNGSGLGLNHIKKIMNSMKGSIIYMNNNYDGLGKGACFELSFNKVEEL